MDRNRITDSDHLAELLPAAGSEPTDAERRVRWAEAELESNLRAGVADVFSRN